MTKEELKTALDAGKKPARIAREIEVSPQTVLNWMHKWGLHRLKDKLTVKFLKKRLREGCSKEQIAKELALDISTINRFIRSKRLKLDVCVHCRNQFHAQKASVKCCSLKCLAWSCVDKGDSDDCWLYNGENIVNGYGRIWNGSGHTVAHLVIWNISDKEPVPFDRELRHQCRNRLCCNPHHLLIGTRSDNVQDSIRDSLRDELNVKLTKTDRGIIDMLTDSGWSCKKIQNTYFPLVCYTTIHRHMKKHKKKP